MNQDQGKPSDSIEPLLIPPCYVGEVAKESQHSADVRLAFDSLHQRLVSAEAKIKNLLPSRDHLICDHVTSRCDECESPTQEATKQDLPPCPDCGHPWNDGCHWCDPSKKQEATKPECEHDTGYTWFAGGYKFESKKVFPKCPYCPTPEPRKLTEVLFDAHESSKFNEAYITMAEAAVKEFKRVIDEYWNSLRVGDDWGFDSLKKYIKDKLL